MRIKIYMWKITYEIYISSFIYDEKETVNLNKKRKGMWEGLEGWNHIIISKHKNNLKQK